MNELLTASLLDLSHTEARPLLEKARYPWEALPALKEFILTLGKTLSLAEYDHPKESVWVHKSATVAQSAYLGEAVIIGAAAEVRHCAYLRESALIGRGVVVGNSTEIKNAILFDEVEVPHFNYVGDGILGYKAHTGAGVVLSNFRSDHGMVPVHHKGERVETNLKKFSAILGDFADIGCNSVLNPGTVIGRGTVVYPLSMVRGTVPQKAIYKKQGEIVGRQER